MKLSMLFAVLVGLGAGVCPARAQDTTSACLTDASGEYVQCRNACREQYQAGKDLCRDVDHDCADACRAGREACVAVPLGDLDACVGDCNDTLASSTQSCRDQFASGTAERDQCIDGAQVIAFQCRDTCREQVDRNQIRLCRVTFHACIGHCPPPPAP